MKKPIVLKNFQMAQRHKCISRIETRYFIADKIKSNEELSLTEPVKHVNIIKNG